MVRPIKLRIFHGNDLVGEHRFAQEVLKVGRLDSAHLKLEDETIARLHLVIEADLGGEGYSVIDMGSVGGTLLNGKPLTKDKLENGDVLVLGDTRLVVCLDDDLWSVSTDELTSAPPTGEVNVAQQLWQASPEELGTALATGEVQVSKALWQASMAELASAPATGEVPAAQALWQATADERASAGPTGPVPVAAALASVKAVETEPQLTREVLASQILWQVSEEELQGADRTGELTAPQIPISNKATASSIPVHPARSAPESQEVVPMAAAQAALLPGGQPVSTAVVPPSKRAGHGAVPSNLAHASVPDTDRALEIKTIWGDSVLDTLNVFDQPTVTMGDERRLEGWGPLQKVVRCDIEVPSRGLPMSSFPLAQSQGPGAANYEINIPAECNARVERADGSVHTLASLSQAGLLRQGYDVPGSFSYLMRPAETLYIEHGAITLQVRYVEKQRFYVAPYWESLNYNWLNILVLAFFFHGMMIVSFVATPVTESDLDEDLFMNRNRFAQFKLKPEEKKDLPSFSLAKLKGGEPGAKARGKEGKAGREDYPKEKKQGRMAIRGNPDEKELAKSTISKLFGIKGNVHRSYLFGTGGLGGELKGALGGVTGAEIGDATGLGGLGLRGSGPGGGGFSMNSVGLGALGTHGRGGGNGGGYGNGIGGLGKKADRDISISMGSPIVMGSLDKELIRRVIKQHLAQIRYCYEKELQRTPGIFGKVGTQFTIAANGSVQVASVRESTLNNGEVERCVTSKIRTWIFPKPKGGGIVIVNYPFVFKQSG